MKAVVENAKGNAFEIKDFANPVINDDAVIIKVVATHVVPFAEDVLNGSLGYMFPQEEFVPGTSAIGIIEEVGANVYDFKVGDRVFCDPRITSNTSSKARIEPDGILIGWTGLSAASGNLLKKWTNGSFAQKALWPQECLTKIDNEIPSEELACMSYLTIAYGGLLKGNLKPSQKILINGGTGGIGAAGTLVALALGASKVIVVGLEDDILDQIKAISPDRIEIVNSSGDFDSYKEKLQGVAQGVDMVLDVLGAVTTPKYTQLAASMLKNEGTIVFMGGVQTDVSFNYTQLMLSSINVTGNFMYPRTAPKEILSMIEAGTIKLSDFNVVEYSIDEFEKAVEDARKHKGLTTCVLTPNKE